jgi:hypothetical protein
MVGLTPWNLTRSSFANLTHAARETVTGKPDGNEGYFSAIKNIHYTGYNYI